MTGMDSLFSEGTRRGARGALVAAALVVAALVVAASAVPALAQDGPGLRAGLSASPDQIFFGGHYVTQPLTGMLRFQPNLEVGLGGGQTTIAFNGEFALWRKISPDWHVYLGGGPSILAVTHQHRDDTDIDPGFNLVAGLRRRGGAFFELKIGRIDSPSFKALVGFTIR
ncbi:MAG TPA: hypothetical protein PLN93_11765 [Vicinamibacterales bacterium]|nr:hypothetical protein [Vicinamibacterales bacterium]HPK72607.1 hypothetical protein [Vicinamibacterales bacterium]